MSRAIPRALAAAALSGALGCSPSPPSGPSAWQTIYEGKDLGGAVLSAWGTAWNDVYIVGGPLGNGGDAIALRFDGSAWTRLDPGGADSYWWVSGSGEGDVWMVGELGRMTHWDGVSFKEHPRLTTATLWGVWSASPTDAWAVGGTPGKGTAAPNDVVLHWDGKAWTQETLPGPPLGRSLNKVWGTSSEDLYAVGEAATVWHRKGTTWALESEPPVASSNLLTVFGCGATDVYAVGGGDVIHTSGAGWAKVTVDLTNQVNGVACDAKGQVLIVGFGGLKQRLVGGKWVDEFDVAPTGDIHGAFSDGAGSFWVAGGEFISKAAPGMPRKALIGRYGPGHVAAFTP